MARITSIWITISDEAGSAAREVFVLDSPINNVVGKITVESVAFYEQGEDKIHRLLESKFTNTNENVALPS